ncbi:MAG TPA: F0F1 ATP synthase subunit B [Pirellulales bacterium]|jgi:F-type H+-transporting ATPase subunit b|nr:F0F1 ATP synthase subunit B [Pirellulales bacterium]
MRRFCERLFGNRLRLTMVVWSCVVLTTGSSGLTIPVVSVAHAADETNAVSTPSASAPADHPDPLQFKTDLALWTFVVFVVLFIVLKKFAWGPITEALDKREHHIAENIEAARRRDEEARELLAEYERKLAGAADQVRAMLDEARQAAEHTKQEIVAEAKAAAQGEHERAMRDIRTATDAAVEQLSERSADLAVQLAGKIISTKLTPEERSRLVKDSLSKFASSAPSRN